MILNRRIPDPSRLKVMVLSCPKTGNTWLRALMRHAYELPIADLPPQWSAEVAASLPDSFVAHQHLHPSAELLQWIVSNDVVVVTSVRHPADTLLSYFHFMKWQGASTDVAARMIGDGDTPGRQTLQFAQYFFPSTYAISLAWARLGAHTVRYEDLAANPVASLHELCARIVPIDAHRARCAAFLSRPEGMIRSGDVNSRHIRTGRAGGWPTELPSDIAGPMREISPYKEACEEYSYSWDTAQEGTSRFDYSAFDPFRGRIVFDNAQPVGKSLAAIYLLYSVPDPVSRWPDPALTAGTDSFWNWLASPTASAATNPRFSAFTFTNLMEATWRMRRDLARRFPDPVDADRLRYVEWFLHNFAFEFQYPWRLISPVMDGYCDYLKASPENA